MCVVCVFSLYQSSKYGPRDYFGVSADKSLSWSVASSVEFCSPHAVLAFLQESSGENIIALHLRQTILLYNII